MESKISKKVKTFPHSPSVGLPGLLLHPENESFFLFFVFFPFFSFFFLLFFSFFSVDPIILFFLELFFTFFGFLFCFSTLRSRDLLLSGSLSLSVSFSLSCIFFVLFSEVLEDDEFPLMRMISLLFSSSLFFFLFLLVSLAFCVGDSTFLLFFSPTGHFNPHNIAISKL